MSELNLSVVRETLHRKKARVFEHQITIDLLNDDIDKINKEIEALEAKFTVLLADTLKEE